MATKYDEAVRAKRVADAFRDEIMLEFSIKNERQPDGVKRPVLRVALVGITDVDIDSIDVLMGAARALNYSGAASSTIRGILVEYFDWEATRKAKRAREEAEEILGLVATEPASSETEGPKSDTKGASGETEADDGD